VAVQNPTVRELLVGDDPAAESILKELDHTLSVEFAQTVNEALQKIYAATSSPRTMNAQQKLVRRPKTYENKKTPFILFATC
jgi:hypothetical protein